MRDGITTQARRVGGKVRRHQLRTTRYPRVTVSRALTEKESLLAAGLHRITEHNSAFARV
ncbi:MAG TPA: hypothetical protein ACQGQI_08685 [Xylella sp.]